MEGAVRFNLNVLKGLTRVQRLKQRIRFRKPLFLGEIICLKKLSSRVDNLYDLDLHAQTLAKFRLISLVGALARPNGQRSMYAAQGLNGGDHRMCEFATHFSRRGRAQLCINRSQRVSEYSSGALRILGDRTFSLALHLRHVGRLRSCRGPVSRRSARGGIDALGQRIRKNQGALRQWRVQDLNLHAEAPAH